MNWKIFALLYTALCALGLTVLARIYPQAFAEGFPLLTDARAFFRAYDYRGIIAGFGGLGLGLIIEWRIVGWQNCAMKKALNPSRSTRRDMITCIAYVLGLWNLIGYTATLGASFFLGAYLGRDHPFAFIAMVPTDFGKALVTLFIVGFFEYWAHRLSHTWRPLWALHKYHHTATEMSVFSAHRNNPFSGPVMAVITTIPFSYFGGTLGSLAWVGVIRIVLDYIIHSEIRSHWGWVGRWILVSPAAHRVHHSAESRHFNCNFGFFLIFWDRVFGTYNADRNIERFGAEDHVFNHKPVAEEMVVSLYRAVSPRADK
jgi:sterol desaturase/sphingolipid hydroxylase (fatty acid hydroxylase superfamily)